MLDNVVHFSGIHGSGKSTLIEDLSKSGPFTVYENIDANYHLEDAYHRAVLRLAKYWVDTQRIKEQAEADPSKIILASRCVYDNLSYVEGFLRIGWCSETEHSHHENSFKAMFMPQDLPKNVVYLCPPNEWAIQKIRERWKTHPKKWREDRFEYLEAVSLAFKELYSKLNSVNALHLKETDREKRVKLVLDWIKSSGLLIG